MQFGPQDLFKEWKIVMKIKDVNNMYLTETISPVMYIKELTREKDTISPPTLPAT